MSEGICATYILCCQLGELCGQSSIKDLPACWEHQINDEWHLSFNGHAQQTLNAKNDPVPAHSVWIQHRGGLACGIISPVGGMVLGASEGELTEVLEVAIRERGGVPATELEPA
jgi:hypothetical protein